MATIDFAALAEVFHLIALYVALNTVKINSVHGLDSKCKQEINF